MLWGRERYWTAFESAQATHRPSGALRYMADGYGVSRCARPPNASHHHENYATYTSSHAASAASRVFWLYTHLLTLHIARAASPMFILRCRYKNDFMEEKEHRLTMFNVPNRLPIGNERSRMGATEFARRSAPALADAYRLEQGVLKIMEDATKDIHGGEKMAYAAFNKAPRVKEEFFKERMAAASPHPSFFSQKQPQMTNLLVDDVRSQPSPATAPTRATIHSILCLPMRSTDHAYDF